MYRSPSSRRLLAGFLHHPMAGWQGVPYLRSGTPGHMNRQGNRKHPEVDRRVSILSGRAQFGVPALLEPGPRRVFLRKLEVLHLRMDEMVCNVRY